MFLIDFCIL